MTNPIPCNKMKITKLGIISGTVALFAFPAVVFAQTIVPSEGIGIRPTLQAEREAITQQRQQIQAQVVQTRQTNLKTRADNEITRRITALNDLITRINGFTRLTADQKSSFVTQIQTEINTLTSLKTKIDADTDTATLKTDVQSIVAEYRVFAL